MSKIKYLEPKRWSDKKQAIFGNITTIVDEF